MRCVAVQVQRAGTEYIARVSVFVTSLAAQVQPAPPAGFSIQFFSKTGAGINGTKALPWSSLLTDAEAQPLVLALHTNLDWFGVVPVADIAAASKQDTEVVLPLALPAKGVLAVLQRCSLRVFCK